MFFFFLQNKMCSPKYVSEALYIRARPIGIGAHFVQVWVFENDSERSIKKTAKLQLVQQSMGFKLSKSFPRELKQVSHSEKFLSWQI